MKTKPIQSFLLVLASTAVCLPAHAGLQHSEATPSQWSAPATEPPVAAPSTPTLTINGQPVDIRPWLAWLQQPNQTESPTVMARLVDEELVFQQAQEVRSQQGQAAEFVTTKAIRDATIADYLKGIAHNAPKPTPQLVDGYFDTHPLLFSERKHFLLDSVLIYIDKNGPDQISDKLNPSMSMADVRTLIQDKHLKAKFGHLNLPSESLPADDMAAIHALPVDGLNISTTSDHITVLSLKSKLNAPIPLDRARPLIEEDLTARNQITALSTELARLRSTATIACSPDLRCTNLPDSDLSSRTATAPKKPPLLQAFLRLSAEWQVATKSQSGGPGWWDALDKMVLSDAAKDAAFRLFGTIKPTTIEQHALPGGQLAYTFGVAPLSFQDGLPPALTMDSAPLSGKTIYDKARAHAKAQANVPFVRIDINQTDFVEIRDIMAQSDTYKGAADIWFGVNKFAAATMRFFSAQLDLIIDKPTMSVSMEQKGKAIHVAVDLSASGATFAGESIGPINMAFGVKNLDTDAFVSIAKSMEQTDAKLDDAAKMVQATSMFDQFGPLLLTSKSAIELKNLSVTYQGWTAKMSGALGFGQIKRGDIYSMSRLIESIRGQFKVTVPVGFIKKVISAVVRHQQADMQAQGKPADPDKTASAEKEVLNNIMGKLVGKGIAKLDGDILRSTIDIAAGKVLINGLDPKVLSSDQ